jgi:hypothetical protein
VAISGIATVEGKGRAITIAAGSPTDTNSITEPLKIAPVTSNVDGLSATSRGPSRLIRFRY